VKDIEASVGDAKSRIGMFREIFLKPHHFLDIIKLYGSGVEKFKPDKKYGHDFYKVGNLILKNPNVIICLTVKADDICNPCKFLKRGRCTDLVTESLGYSLKQNWNEAIDKRILKTLGLEEGGQLTAIKFCQLAKEKLRAADIRKIWRERPAEEVKSRIKNLMSGLERYC